MTQRTQRLCDLLQSVQRKQDASGKRLVVTGHDEPDVDSVISCVLFRALAAQWGVHVQIVLPTRADGQSRRVLPRFGVDPDAFLDDLNASDAVALVDHHQPLHPGCVVCCIDHHPTDHQPDMPYVLIEPAGACAVMILRLMQEADMPTTDEQTAMAVTALYLDTIALQSSKITPEEVAWAQAEADRLGMDKEWLKREGMNLCDMSVPAQALAMQGKKVYRFLNRRVISSYVQTDAMTPHTLHAILDVLREAVRTENAALWVFLVHDPIAGRSTEFDIAPDGRIEKRRYDHLVSRGKDIMPRVEREMEERGEPRDIAFT